MRVILLYVSALIIKKNNFELPSRHVMYVSHIAKIDGRKSICNEKDDCPRNARYCIVNGKCIPIEVYTASWGASRILHADVDNDKRVDNYAGE